jgi:hypothetical protein
MIAAVLIMFPVTVIASESTNTAIHLDLTHHIMGYVTLLVTIMAYVAAMAEDVIE